MQPLTSAPSAAELAYTEYGKLAGSIKDSPEGLRQAARQFESIFVSMWLKAARDANKVLAENSPFASSELELHQEMLDQQLAVHLANGGGIGLAPIIVRQLGGTEDGPPLRHPAALNLAGTAAVDRKGVREPAFASREDFLETIRPKVETVAREHGIPALAMLGQAALETGWGSAVPADPTEGMSHNLFGMKAGDWAGPTVDMHSKEFELGRWVDRLSSFRAYPDWDSSIADYAGRISSTPRYQEAMQRADDPREYLGALQHAGYATDPGYADKVLNIIKTIQNLAR